MIATRSYGIAPPVTATQHGQRLAERHRQLRQRHRLLQDNSARVGKELQFAITLATTMDHLVHTAEADLRSASSSSSKAAEAVYEIKARVKDTNGLAQAAAELHRRIGARAEELARHTAQLASATQALAGATAGQEAAVRAATGLQALSDRASETTAVEQRAVKWQALATQRLEMEQRQLQELRARESAARATADEAAASVQEAEARAEEAGKAATAAEGSQERKSGVAAKALAGMVAATWHARAARRQLAQAKQDRASAQAETETRRVQRAEQRRVAAQKVEELEGQLASVEPAASLQQASDALEKEAARKTAVASALAQAQEAVQQRSEQRQAQWSAAMKEAEEERRAAAAALDAAKSGLAAVPALAGGGAQDAKEASAAAASLRGQAEERLATAQERAGALGQRLREAEGRRAEVDARVTALALRARTAERVAAEAEEEAERVRGEAVRVRAELQQLSAEGLLYTGTPCAVDKQRLAQEVAASQFEELEREVERVVETARRDALRRRVDRFQREQEEAARRREQRAKAQALSERRAARRPAVGQQGGSPGRGSLARGRQRDKAPLAALETASFAGSEFRFSFGEDSESVAAGAAVSDRRIRRGDAGGRRRTVMRPATRTAPPPVAPSPQPTLFHAGAVTPSGPRRGKRAVRRRPRGGKSTHARQKAVDAMPPPPGGEEFEFDLFDA